MAKYLLLRDNKQTGPHSFEEMLELGFRKYDLVWVEGKSAAWRYAGEISEFQSYAPLVEEQPYDRFFKRKVTPAAAENTAAPEIALPVESKPKTLTASELLKARRVAITMPANRSSGSHVIVPQRKEPIAVSGDKKEVDLPQNTEPAPEPVAVKNNEVPAADPPPIRSSEPAAVRSSEVLPEPVEHLSKKQEPLQAAALAAVSEVAPAPDETRYSTQHSPYLPGAAPAPSYSRQTVQEDEDDEELIPLSQIPPKPFSGDYTGVLQYTGVAAALVSLLVVGILIGKGMGNNYTAPPPVVSEQPSRIAELKKKLMAAPIAEPEEVVPEFESDDAGIDVAAINVPAKGNAASVKKDIGVRTSYKTPASSPVNSSAGEKRESVKRSTTTPTPEKTATDKADLASKLKVSLNEYKVNMFGGIDGIEVTVKNGAAVPVTEAVVELRYILSNRNKKHLTETVVFKNLRPGESSTLPGPKSAKGIKLEYSLVSAR
jgi:hypothetical protein